MGGRLWTPLGDLHQEVGGSGQGQGACSSEGTSDLDGAPPDHILITDSQGVDGTIAGRGQEEGCAKPDDPPSGQTDSGSRSTGTISPALARSAANSCRWLFPRNVGPATPVTATDRTPCISTQIGLSVTAADAVDVKRASRPRARITLEQ